MFAALIIKVLHRQKYRLYGNRILIISILLFIFLKPMNMFSSIVTKNGKLIEQSYLQFIDDKDKIQYIAPSPKPTFERMLAGVKIALLYFDGHNAILNGYKNYLNEMGFEVVVANSQNIELITKKYAQRKDVILVTKMQSNSQNVYTFLFAYPPLSYEWEFSSRISDNEMLNYIQNGISMSNIAYEIFRRAYGYRKPQYNKAYELSLPKWKTGWTKESIISNWQQNSIKSVEGIYENTTRDNHGKYIIAVKYMQGTFKLIYLSGAENTMDWTEGELKATLYPTSTPNLYKAKWIKTNKIENDNFYISFEQGTMNVLSEKQERNLYIKMYPVVNNKTSPNTIRSGTGFAITSNGLIVTNYHVVEEGKSFRIKGVKGNFSESYNAKVVAIDKNNDLAILKIKDSKFQSTGSIPYVIKSRTSDVGENVFALGYPLRALMGDEIKLTSGIVSSKSGYKGDITLYQISVPVQPGNSGGPLFDNRGNLIGISAAKLGGDTQNVSYAIKSSYLLSLIDTLVPIPNMQNISKVAGKPLTSQVAILKEFIYIIDVE